LQDHELLVLSDSSDLSEFSLAVNSVYSAFTKDLEVYCWSSVFALPPLDERGKIKFVAELFFVFVSSCSYSADPSTSLPYLARLGSRGNCGSMMSDASAFEIYAFYNVNTDPYKTISAVRERVMRKI
jgi:hypothetical protein